MARKGITGTPILDIPMNIIGDVFNSDSYLRNRIRQEKSEDTVNKFTELQATLTKKEWEDEEVYQETLDNALATNEIELMGLQKLHEESGFVPNAIKYPMYDVLADVMNITDKGDVVSAHRVGLFIGGVVVGAVTGSGFSKIPVMAEILQSAYATHLDMERRRLAELPVTNWDIGKSFTIDLALAGLGQYVGNGGTFAKEIRSEAYKSKNLLKRMAKQGKKQVELNEFVQDVIVKSKDTDLASLPYYGETGGANVDFPTNLLPHKKTMLFQSEQTIDLVTGVDGQGKRFTQIMYNQTGSDGADAFDVKIPAHNSNFNRTQIFYNRGETGFQRDILRVAKEEGISMQKARKLLRERNMTRLQNMYFREWNMIVNGTQDYATNLKGIIKESPQVRDMVFGIRRAITEHNEMQSTEILDTLSVLTNMEIQNYADIYRYFDNRNINITHAIDDPTIVTDDTAREVAGYLEGYHFSTIDANNEIAYRSSGDLALFGELEFTGFLKKHMPVIGYDPKTESYIYGIDLDTFDHLGGIDEYVDDFIDKAYKNANELLTTTGKKTKDHLNLKRKLKTMVHRVLNFEYNGLERSATLYQKNIVLRDLVEAFSDKPHNALRVFRNKIKPENKELFEKLRELLKQDTNTYDMFNLGSKKSSEVVYRGKTIDLMNTKTNDFLKEANGDVNVEGHMLNRLIGEVQNLSGRIIAGESGFTDFHKNWGYYKKLYNLSDDVKVKIVDKIPSDYVGNGIIVGEYLPSTKTISILKGDKYQMISVLRHEIEHAVDLTQRGGAPNPYRASPEWNLPHPIDGADDTLWDTLSAGYDHHFKKYLEDWFELKNEFDLTVKEGYMKEIGEIPEGTEKIGVVKQFDYNNDEDVIVALKRLYDVITLSTEGQARRWSERMIATYGFKSIDHFKHFMHSLGGGDVAFNGILKQDMKKNSWFRAYGMSEKQFKNSLNLQSYRKNYANTKFNLSGDDLGLDKQGKKNKYQYVGKEGLDVGQFMLDEINGSKPRVSPEMKRSWVFRFSKMIHDLFGTLILDGRGSNEAVSSVVLTNMAKLYNGHPITSVMKDLVFDMPQASVDYLKIGTNGFINSTQARVEFVAGRSFEDVPAIFIAKKWLDISGGELAHASKLSTMIKDFDDYVKVKKPSASVLGRKFDNSKMGKRLNKLDLEKRVDRWHSRVVEMLQAGDYKLKVKAMGDVQNELRTMTDLEDFTNLNGIQQAMVTAYGKDVSNPVEVEEFIKALQDIRMGDDTMDVIWAMNDWRYIEMRTAVYQGYGMSNMLERGRLNTSTSPEEEGVLYLMNTLLAIGSETIRRLTGTYEHGGIYRADDFTSVFKKVLGTAGIVGVGGVALTGLNYMDEIGRFITDKKAYKQQWKDFDLKVFLKDFFRGASDVDPTSIYSSKSGGSAYPSIMRALEFNSLRNTSAKMVMGKPWVEMLLQHKLFEKYLEVQKDEENKAKKFKGYDKKSYQQSEDSLNEIMAVYINEGGLLADMEKESETMIRAKDRYVDILGEQEKMYEEMMETYGGGNGYDEKAIRDYSERFKDKQELARN